MPRDYAQKKAAARPAPRRSRVPRWVWLFTTSVVVLFAGGLFLLSQLPQDSETGQVEWPSLADMLPDSPTGEEPVPSPSVEPGPDEDTSSLSRQAQLEFYTLLQQTDVFVPDEVVALRQREVLEDTDELIEESLPETPESTESPGQFVIQVASFSSASDAEALRAQLILEGMTSAHVTEADLGERGIFHRVMIGPVGSTQETQALGSRLEDMGLQGLVRNHSPG